VALKRGVGDHTPERFADYELTAAGLTLYYSGAMRKTVFAALLAAMSTTALADAAEQRGGHARLPFG